MRINRLVLQNFRCFERLELELDERMTLLVGTNGAGKTAVLDGLAIALGAWLSGTSQVAHEDRTIKGPDARLVRQESAGLATSNPTFPVRVEADGRIDLESLTVPSHWVRELRRVGGRTTTSHADELRMVARSTESQAVADPRYPLPLIAYYGTGRLWVQKRVVVDSRSPNSRMRGYTACLEFASNHKLFELWMETREGDRIQRLAAAQSAGGDLTQVRSPHLEAVEKATLACLEGAQRFYYSINHQELRVEFEGGQEIPFSSLSDGQRSLIVLAADMAWRTAQLNPHYGSDAPRKTAGIVLIDEIELHLHPQWQRAVVGNLMRAFENIQFVMTTHSPQVVSTAQPEWMRVLHADGSWDRVEHTYGRNSDALLRDVFGVSDRLRDVRERIEKVEALLGSGDLQGARAALSQLETDLGPTDDLVSGLRWEILDAEVHGSDGDLADDAAD
jgi:predicted ATP-binding protein involved in virulence